MSLYLPGPQLLGLLVAFISGLVAWGFWRHRKYRKNNVQIKWNDAVLMIFFLLALFILIIFWTSFLFRFVP